MTQKGAKKLLVLCFFIEIFHCKSPCSLNKFDLKHFKALLKYESILCYILVYIDDRERKSVKKLLLNRQNNWTQYMVKKCQFTGSGSTAMRVC